MDRIDNHREDGPEEPEHQQAADALQMASLRRVHRTLAHDLRAPFHAAFLQIELLRLTAEREAAGRGSADRSASGRDAAGRKGGTDDSPYRAPLERLDRALHQLRDGLEDLLSQFESHDAHRAIDLSELAREVCSVCRPQAKHVGIRLKAEADEPIDLRGRPDRIRALVLGLLTMALDLLGRDGRVTVGTSRSGERATLQVDAEDGAEKVGTEATGTETTGTDHDGSKRDGNERERLVRALAESEGAQLEVSSEAPGRRSWRLVWPA